MSLPPEARANGKCGKLQRWLYGMRGAGNAWERDYSKRFLEAGFTKGRSAPTVFYHEERQLRCVVHGDDFTFLGFDSDLDHVTGLMSSWYDIKVRGRLGGGRDDQSEITILNRPVRWVGDTVEFEVEPKHVQVMCDAFDLCGKSAGSEWLAVKET